MSNGFQQRWESLAVLAANLIVRLWPSDTKDWARAFAAELPEAETISQSLRWLLGGVMLLTRERFRDFLKALPARWECNQTDRWKRGADSFLVFVFRVRLVG